MPISYRRSFLPFLSSRLARSLLVFGLLALSALSLPAAEQDVRQEGFSFLRAPVPAWVREEAAASGSSGLPSAPMHYAVIDEQMLLAQGEETRFTHVESVIDAPAGLPAAARIRIPFAPAFQQLVMHRLDIVRNGQRIDRLNQGEVQLLQREVRADGRADADTVTAVIVLSDLRVGDRVDYAYSLRGANPTFEGRLVDTRLAASEQGPVAVYRLRLLAPEQREIKYQAGPDVKIQSRVEAGLRETIFRREAVAPPQGDPYAPASAYFDELIELSEYKDWQEVAAWGRQLFAAAFVPAPRVEAQAASIRARAGTASERLLLALDFVQKEIASSGNDTGMNMRPPQPPEQLLASRLGDGKDKSTLLLALLKALDIDAAPVLASSYLRNQLELKLPGPAAFDRVIVLAKVDGMSYWLDPGRSFQRGPLAQRQAGDLGKGLVLQTGAKGLSDLPAASSAARLFVDETLHFDKVSEPPLLKIRISYYGVLAERLREMLAHLPRSQIEAQIVAELRRYRPQLRVRTPLRIEESPDANAVVLTQEFTLPDCLQVKENALLVGEFGLWNIVQAVRYTGDSQRRLAYQVRAPGIYVHTFGVEFPEKVFTSEEKSHFIEDNEFFKYQVDYESRLDSVRIKARLHLLADVVSAEDWPRYVDKLQEVRRHSAQTMKVPLIPPAAAERLNAELAEMKERLSMDRTRATPSQNSAKLQLKTLNALVDGARLNDGQLADVLRERATQFDTLGENAKAAADLARALKLAPDDAKLLAAAASNALRRGDDQGAAAYARGSLQLAPAQAEPQRILALVDYFRGDWAGAQRGFEKLREQQDEQGRMYTALWLYLAVANQGGEAQRSLRAQLPSFASRQWPYALLQYFAAAEDSAALRRQLDDEADSFTRRCELNFYLGEKSRSAGRMNEAAAYFRQVLDTKVVEALEYTAAQRRLGK